MRISEAKEEIKNTYIMYHKRDEGGMYRMPQVRQRPVLLIGPPGIGKTAIMEQISEELGCGLVSYTMTHHTRQSAVGLPRIVREHCSDHDIETTRYTMSEIIASMYEYMDRTGRKEGILFIDEINCVSETLTPVMLELLQNKRFGTHRVPEGWMIVAAGNPPEYNRSVRPMDIVTLDRVRRIDVEPDLETWLEYAQQQGIHGAVTSFLALKKDHFYMVKNAEDGRHFVTARGWEDLSWMLNGYEDMGVAINVQQIAEFIEDPGTAQSFASYYHIRRRWGEDFGITEIFDGTLGEEELLRKEELMRSGTFEERFTAALLMADLCINRIRTCETGARTKDRASEWIRDFCDMQHSADEEPLTLLGKFIESRENALQIKIENDLISEKMEREERRSLAILRSLADQAREDHIRFLQELKLSISVAIAIDIGITDTEKERIKEGVDRILETAVRVFGEEQETILLVSALRRDEEALHFLWVNKVKRYEELVHKLLRDQEDRE